MHQDNDGNHRRPILIFAELERGGKKSKCPRCHVPFIPHLGHAISKKFRCESCKGYISPSSNISRPQNNLILLYCGGCNMRLVYQKGDRTVKRSLCKHITTPTNETYGVPPANRAVPPQLNRIFPPHLSRVNPTTNAETESTASSSFTPKPEIIVVEYPDDSVGETVRNVAVEMRTIKGDVEEDKTEASESESKKIRL